MHNQNLCVCVCRITVVGSFCSQCLQAVGKAHLELAASWRWLLKSQEHGSRWEWGPGIHGEVPYLTVPGVCTCAISWKGRPWGKGETKREVIRSYLAQLSQLIRDGDRKDGAGSR